LPEFHVRKWLEGILPGPEDALLAQAAELQAQGKVEEAEALYEKVLETRPRDGDAHFQLARILAARGEIDAAERHLGLILPDDAERLEKEIATLRLKMAGDGLEEAERAVAKDPEDREARLRLGKALAAAEQYERALDVFLEVLRGGPRDEIGEAARAAMVEIFGAVGTRSELADRYRSLMAAELYRCSDARTPIERFNRSRSCGRTGACASSLWSSPSPSSPAAPRPRRRSSRRTPSPSSRSRRRDSSRPTPPPTLSASAARTPPASCPEARPCSFCARVRAASSRTSGSSTWPRRRSASCSPRSRSSRAARKCSRRRRRRGASGRDPRRAGSPPTTSRRTAAASSSPSPAGSSWSSARPGPSRNSPPRVATPSIRAFRRTAARSRSCATAIST